MAVQRPGRIPQGMAVTEFLLIATPVLLTGLGALEVARWHVVRQTVHQALLEAARAGATRHAEPQAIHDHLRLGLMPLYASAATAAGMDAGQRRQDQYARRLHERHGLTPWHLEILSPQPAHFKDFASIAGADGVPRIPNSYQAERHRAALADGRPGGRGAASGATIFEANTLTLRITYPHPPLVPGLGSLLRALGRAAAVGGYTGEVLREAGMLPIRQQLSVAMQSDALWWPGTGATAPLRAPITSAGPVSACTGIWCQRDGNFAATPPAPAPPRFDQSGATAAGVTLLAAPGPEEGCGVVLCCT